MLALNRTTGLLALTLAALALLFAGCGGGGGGSSTLPPAPAPSSSGTIGVAGGELEGPDGNLTGTLLVVPAGALDQDEEIRISQGRNVTYAPEHNLVGPAVTVEPHGLTFAGEGATLRIPYDSSSLPPGSTPETLAVLKRAADGTVHRLEVIDMPAGGDFLEVRVTSLSSFQAVLTTVDATGQWVMGSVGDEFDPSQFDIDDFNLEDFDFSEFDPSEFDPEDFDFSSFDFSDFDLNNFDPSDFDLGALSELEGLPVELFEIVQNTDQGTFELITDETDADGETIRFSGTIDGSSYTASGSYPGEEAVEFVEIEFELYSDGFGTGTIMTTIDGETTTENVGLVRAEDFLEAPTYGSGFARIPLTISDLSEPSDDTLPASSLEEGSYSGTFLQLASDESTGLVIATYLLDSDTSNPFLGTVTGVEYIFVRTIEMGDGENLIEILQLTRTSQNTFIGGALNGTGFAWIYSDGAEGMNFGTGSASLGN